MNLRVESKSRLNLICDIEYGYNDNYMTEEFNVSIDWEGQSKTPLMNFSRELIQ